MVDKKVMSKEELEKLIQLSSRSCRVEKIEEESCDYNCGNCWEKHLKQYIQVEGE